MNKIVGSPEQAVADIPNGATVAIAGFGVASPVLARGARCRKSS